jgi:transcriptional regulator with XRE-family HTH domain
MSRDLASAIKSARKSKKYSQTMLAHECGVALATIQNIEAGIANPTFSTVVSVLNALGLKFIIEEKQTDWKSLIRYGLPIISQEQDAKASSLPTKSELVYDLSAINFKELSKESIRVKSAVASFLSALKDHFASVYIQLPVGLRVEFELNESENISPKLRRIALAKLSEYL